MAATGYQTSATCTLEVMKSGRLTPISCQLQSISMDGAEILCDTAFVGGMSGKVRIDGYTMDAMDFRVQNVQANKGRGYQIAIKLKEGCWPYAVFTDLANQSFSSQMTHSSSGFSSRSSAPTIRAPAPPCFVELGLNYPCTAEDVENSFHRLVRTAHPDRGGNIEKFIQLRAAYMEALNYLGAKR